MRIWIDLVNSPHIPFFMPVMRRLEESGHEIFVTYRDFAQTAKLVELYNIPGKLIGSHGGKSRLGKIANLAKRTFDLIKFARDKQFDVAISHNSYFQILAAKVIGIKSITSMDFEGTPANHLAFRLASLVSVPSAFPDDCLQKFGARNVVKYRGLKENICLADFKVNACYIDSVKDAFELNDSDMLKPIVIVRPPPSLALYHNNESDLFESTLNFLSNQDITVLVLPRVNEQAEKLKIAFPLFKFSDQVLDGFQLVNCSDMVISGGGSMNREAACLGVQAVSLFSGELPAVDQYLEKEGKLIFISDADQINALDIRKKERFSDCRHSDESINDFINHIYQVAL